MLNKILPACVFTAFLASCKVSQPTASMNVKPSFIKISTQYPLYFETVDNRTWLPVMINYIVPNNKDEANAFETIESYFSNFSKNGGNAMRIWISSPFLEIEDQKAGQYNPVKFRRIDRLLQLAEKYRIRIKFTLHHIRTISTREVRQPWANSTILSSEAGGPFKNIKEYINTPLGKKYYLSRAKALAERYRDNKQIFCWELWNEMDAVDTKDWYPFTSEILDSVKALFPNQLVTQTLGSLDSKAAVGRYEQYFALDNNPFVSLHRYIDPGKDPKDFPAVTSPVDLLVLDAMALAKSKVQNKPVVFNETGAVEANHAGPSKLYPADTAGVLIHDMVFAPFFCGAAGTGAMWHWDSYVEKQRLWYHYQRFQNAVKGIDPVKEEFASFTFNKNGVRSYGLKGKTRSVIWCRNADNNWKTELVNKIPPAAKEAFIITLPESRRAAAKKVRVYDPWKDVWTTAVIKDGAFSLPVFERSVVVVVE